MDKKIHLKFNDLAPDAKLLDGNGNPIQLSSLWKNHVLVLAFTRHFGCPQCKEMVDQLIDAHQTLTDRGLLLAIVSHATSESVKTFCDQRAPGVLCLADTDRAVYKAYGLYRGNLWQTIISPRIWSSNRRLARQKGFKPELPLPGQDAYQMSGTFVIGMDGRIRLPYYYEDIADHPPVDLLLHGIMGADWKKPFDTKPLV
ncbi:MAG: redoxin domain-containing protein [Chloroflexi bacterium]|nr:redoxin domain-containing protein [Chloroflexota bacterium]